MSSSSSSNNSPLSVDLGERSYPIHIGSALLDQSAQLIPQLRGRRVMVVSNDRVAPLYLDQLSSALEKLYDVHSVRLPDGEQFKTLDSINQIMTALLEQRFNRQDSLLALGGGVIGDMTGFAAACYQRGVDFVQVPTTLLSQVDSSVGGKTGVNHPLGKNMIGAFHQPRAVIIDTDTLNTLDDRELSAGLAEVIKYGLIYDADFFSWLEANIDGLMQRDPRLLQIAIQRSCEIKAAIVAEDEHESGIRAILNLGHTFGHAIEAAMGYGAWLHGEAVAAGMVLAVRFSSRLGWIDSNIEKRSVDLLQRAALPVKMPTEMTVEQCLSLMSVDKKNVGSTIRLVLLKALGQAVVSDDYPIEQLRQLLGEALGES